MSIPVTRAPARAAGMARLPVPHATSSTDSPGRSASRAMNSSAPGAKLRAMGRKSPEVQTARALAVRGSSDQARNLDPGTGTARCGKFVRMTCRPFDQWVRARPSGARHQSAGTDGWSANDWSSRLPAPAYDRRCALCGSPAELPDRPDGRWRGYARMGRRASRQAPGASPVAFLKARLKAASESYPTSAPIVATLAPLWSQQVGGDLHPPLGQVLHRRLADQLARTAWPGWSGTRRLREPARRSVQGWPGRRMEQRQVPDRPPRPGGRRASRSAPAAGPRGSGAAPR